MVNCELFANFCTNFSKAIELQSGVSPHHRVSAPPSNSLSINVVRHWVKSFVFSVWKPPDPASKKDEWICPGSLNFLFALFAGALSLPTPPFCFYGDSGRNCPIGLSISSPVATPDYNNFVFIAILEIKKKWILLIRAMFVL